MNQFLKNILLFIIPLVLLCAIPIGSFYILDPFKILKPQKEFTNSIVAYNEDYVATERYLKNKSKFNAFIFGSSRAGSGFDVSDWEDHLDEKSKTYSFTASNESIFGIYGKVRLLDEEKSKIDNVIIVIDTDITMKKVVNSKGHLYIKHPRVSHESENAFATEFLKDYFFTGFFIRYLDYKIFEKQRNYMKGYLDFSIDNLNQRYIPFQVKRYEITIQQDRESYYKNRSDIFYKRSVIEKESSKKIDSKSVNYLLKIKKIFNKHNTDYKIVISPLYDQQKMNTLDINILNDIFGEDSVFDFSGKNDITDDIHNYYEASHYRMKIGKQILKKIYNTDK